MPARAGPPAQQSATVPAALGFRMPAEWEPHAATWLAWPHRAGDWPGKAAAIVWVFAEIVRHLQRREQVRILTRSAAEQQRATHVLQRAGAALNPVQFVRAATNRSWTRDYLPTFVVRRTARGQELGAVKWRFNGWARYRDHQLDDAAGLAVAQRHARHCWQPEAVVRGRARRVVLEGGAIDVDGAGTLLASESCLLSGPTARNPGLGRTGLEQVLRDYLGVTQVVWLPDGVAGDDTGGHVDDFVRLVAPGRVVLSQERRRKDVNYRPLARARERLQQARDARGQRLEIIELPMPAPLAYGSDRLPASYANFYLANGLVLVPSFNDPADRKALGLLAELFGDREVVGIHCVDLVAGLGTLHCSTQQQPAAGPRG